ncbi:MAG: hypothetical protein F9B45_30735 [Phycisphaera sp. RhM]|nr:hypothetical protein [Phycisphaera sp. RhM]
MSSKREYSPVDDGVVPIADDVERFGYLDGKGVIDAINDFPPGLVGVVTKNASRRADIVRRIDGFSVLDHTQSILELLHEWLILHRYDEASRQLVRRFEALVNMVACWELRVKDRIPAEPEHDNLTWIVGDGASQDLAEIQSEAQELNRFMRHMASVLPRSGDDAPQVVTLQQIAPHTGMSVDWLKKKKRHSDFPKPTKDSTERKQRFEYGLVRDFLMEHEPNIGQILPNRLPVNTGG